MTPRTNNPKGRRNVVIGFSAPPELRDAIDKAAKAEGRTRSNWLQRTIERILNEEPPTRRKKGARSA